MPEESGDISPGLVALGESVENLRLARGWSQKKLAEISGVSRTTIREIEQHEKPGRRQRSTLERLSEALGVEKSHLGEVHALRRPKDPAPKSRPTVSNLGDTLERFSGRISAIEGHLDSINRRLGTMEISLRQLGIRFDLAFPDPTARARRDDAPGP